MSGLPVGPARERLISALDWESQFARAIGVIAAQSGDLLFPEPFDLKTSAALWLNDRGGPAAWGLFEAERRRVRRTFIPHVDTLTDGSVAVRLHEYAGGLWREVIDTVVVDMQVARELLLGFLCECNGG